MDQIGPKRTKVDLIGPNENEVDLIGPINNCLIFRGEQIMFNKLYVILQL